MASQKLRGRVPGADGVREVARSSSIESSDPARYSRGALRCHASQSCCQDLEFGTSPTSPFANACRRVCQTNKDVSLCARRQPGHLTNPPTKTSQPGFRLAAQRLDRIVGAVPGLAPGSRVLDVGSGIGALIPHLQRAGVADILAVDLSSGMLAKLRQRFPDPGPLGNEPGVRTSGVTPLQTSLCAPTL